MESGANYADTMVPNTTFLVDYCKRGSTKCKKCGRHILVGELRIGKSVKFKAKYIYQYLHTHCAFESFNKARLVANAITYMDDMLGFDLIKDEDRIKILQMLDKSNAERKRPFVEPKEIRKKVNRIPPPSELGYRPKLSSIKAPSIKVMYTNADQMTPSKKQN